MTIHKKGLIVLLLLDIAFVILSTDLVVKYYLAETTRWYAYIPFAIILVMGVIGLIINRKQSEAILPITKMQYRITRGLTFAFIIVYIVQMILIPNPHDYQVSLTLLIASFLGAIGIASLAVHLYILVKGHKK